MKKKFYETPEAEAFVVRIERGLCQSTQTTGGPYSLKKQAYVEDQSEEDWGW